MNIDILLTNIVSNQNPKFETLVSTRDARTLKSLASDVVQLHFITESQGHLILKILKENSKKLESIVDDMTVHTDNPSWTHKFRYVKPVRKLSIVQELPESYISIEFTFCSQIRNVIQKASQQLDITLLTSGRSYAARFSEENIVHLCNMLAPFDFEIDQEILDYYNTITAWSKSEIQDQFLITSITHPNLQKQLAQEIGADIALSDPIINDRSMRYQYRVTSPVQENSLTANIANRQSVKFWVDSKQYSLTEVVKSLVELKRTPILITFDPFNDNAKDLEMLSTALAAVNITDNVGIYFRLSNVKPSGKAFNEQVSAKQYNSMLTSSTLVVGLDTQKLPKFILKENWKPMSVISLNGVLRSSKVAALAHSCDLIIAYWDREPIIQRQMWE